MWGSGFRVWDESGFGWKWFGDEKCQFQPYLDENVPNLRIPHESQKEQILFEVGTEIQKHEFQADSDRRSIQELSGIVESPRNEIDHIRARVHNFDEINIFSTNNYQNKIENFVKLIWKVSMRW